MRPDKTTRTWLVMQRGPSAGTRFLIRASPTSVGRDPSNDVVMQGEGAELVSSRHLEIRKEGDSYHLHDLRSTNGTFVDGQRVSDAVLKANSLIQLGKGGPAIRFELDVEPEADPDKTVVFSQQAMRRVSLEEAAPKGSLPAAAAAQDTQEHLLSKAVLEARKARGEAAKRTSSCERCWARPCGGRARSSKP